MLLTFRCLSPYKGTGNSGDTSTWHIWKPAYLFLLIKGLQCGFRCLLSHGKIKYWIAPWSLQSQDFALRLWMSVSRDLYQAAEWSCSRLSCEEFGTLLLGGVGGESLRRQDCPCLHCEHKLQLCVLLLGYKCLIIVWCSRLHTMEASAAGPDLPCLEEIWDTLSSRLLKALLPGWSLSPSLPHGFGFHLVP